jgi:hypothetical protein
MGVDEPSTVTSVEDKPKIRNVQVEHVKAPWRNFDAFTRRRDVRYSSVSINILSALIGTVWFLCDIPGAVVTGDYLSPLLRLLLVVPTAVGIWIDGRDLYLSVLGDLEAFCRKEMPLFAARAAEMFSRERNRINQPPQK